MKPILNSTIRLILIFIVTYIIPTTASATHAQGTDITYQCLGNNQYRINLAFYRDCAGVNAPQTATVSISSASCNQQFSITLNRVPGTGIDVTPICPNLTTQCNGGTYPGVQEYLYTGIVTLPMQCADWVFGFSLCCRNNAITNILNPGNENIYVESTLNNLNFNCNNSPSFLNKPIPFICVGQTTCFNNGTNEPDGDSVSYKLITPKTSPTSTVTYSNNFSATQPLSSTPAVSFSTKRGDLCMTPTALEVTVLAVIVEEWRNGVMIGSVMRDIQLKTVTCNNTNPYVNGIDNTGNYSITACANAPLNFTIPTFDPDANQNVSITWDGAIPNATFTSSGGSRPTGTFAWTPSTSDIGNTYCFTVTVKDDNCAYFGSQIFSFCITVDGFSTTTSSINSNCGLANGSASVSANPATGQYNYFWPSCGCTTSTINGLSSGTYSVVVTSALGCSITSTVTVDDNGGALNVNLTSTNILCYGNSTGNITANANGAQPPYTYSWSNGPTTSNNPNLGAGTYSVLVTSANGCSSTVAGIITQPNSPINSSINTTPVTCYGLSNGSAILTTNGGSSPYQYSWNTTPNQTGDTIIGLTAGTYSVLITDNNGCTASASAIIIQPNPLNANAMLVNNVSCYGLSDGSATVGVSGGTTPYTYLWNSNTNQSQQTVNGLGTGIYTVVITDANNCTATSTVTITQPSALTITANGSNITCYGMLNGQASAITSGGTPNYTYQWLPNGGTSASTSGLSAGTYTVITTDANGCIQSATININQPAPIVVTATGNTTICLGQNTVIAANATGGNGGYIFTWSGNGNLSGATHVVSPTTPTTYTVTVVDANGCPGNTATVAINVTSLTAANLNVSPGVRICEGDSATIYSFVSGNTGTVNVTWNNNLGTGNGPFTVNPTTSTTYIVTVTDLCNNTISSSVAVIVNPLPDVVISPVQGKSCEAVPVEFKDNSTTNSGASYLWNFGDGNYSNQPNPSHTYYSSGTYTVNVIVTSLEGCVDSSGTTATVLVLPGSHAKFESQAMDGTTVSPKYQFYNLSNNSISYEWNFGDGNKSFVENPLHEYTDKGDYIVSLYTVSKDGCKDTTQMKVMITPEFTIYIPNAFTPDGDGLNDVFIPKGIEIGDFVMEIYSRWGEMIYRTDDINIGWDGRANDGTNVAQMDVYVYKILVKDINQKSHQFLGQVTLIKNDPTSY